MSGLSRLLRYVLVCSLIALTLLLSAIGLIAGGTISIPALAGDRALIDNTNEHRSTKVRIPIFTITLLTPICRPTGSGPVPMTAPEG